MVFKENNNSIFQQIAESLCDAILAGEYGAGERVPSVREYAVTLRVNPNTVMRGYESLAQDGILVNRRGIGFFVADDATDRIRRLREEEFLEGGIHDVFRRLDLLGVTPSRLMELYTEYLNNRL